MNDMNESDSQSRGWLDSFRRLADSLLALISNRIELFTVELQEEKLRGLQPARLGVPRNDFGNGRVPGWFRGAIALVMEHDWLWRFDRTGAADAGIGGGDYVRHSTADPRQSATIYRNHG